MAKEGRPTKYKPSLVQAVYDYVDSCVDDHSEFHKLRGDKMDGYDRIKKVRIPLIAGLSIYLKVAESSIWLWSEKYPKFSAALKHLKAVQQQKLVEGGLSNEYNPLIAKLILASNHGMSDKVENQITGKDGGPIVFVPAELMEKYKLNATNTGSKPNSKG